MNESGVNGVTAIRNSSGAIVVVAAAGKTVRWTLGHHRQQGTGQGSKGGVEGDLSAPPGPGVYDVPVKGNRPELIISANSELKAAATDCAASRLFLSGYRPTPSSSLF